MRAAVFSGLILLVTIQLRAAAPPDGNVLVKPSLLADTTAVEPGKPFRVAVHFKIEPKWHIYWIYPGDSGQPPEVKWKLPEGFIVGDLEWPVPHRFDLPGGIVNYGYDGEVALLATITPPAKISGKSVAISAEISWLVCDPDLCLPGAGTASLSVPVGKSITTAHPDEFEKWTALLPQRIGETGVPASIGADAAAITATPTQTIAWKGPVKDVEWFIAVPDGMSLNSAEAKTHKNTTQLSVDIKPMGGNNSPPGRIYTVIAYSNEHGQRKGIEFWLNVDQPPGAGGGGQAGQ